MIEINLLPESLREVEHTPWPRLATILIGLIIFLTVSYLASSEYLNVITVLKDKITTIEDFNGSDQAKKGEKRVDDLVKDIQEKKKRKEILSAIVNSKIMWSQKLDEFNKVVSDSFPNRLWFDSVDISSTQKIDFAKSNSPIVMKMIAKGHLMLNKEDSGSVAGESIGSNVSRLQTQLKTADNAFGKNIDQDKFKIGSWTATDNVELKKIIVDFPLEVYFLPTTFLSTETPKTVKK